MCGGGQQKQNQCNKIHRPSSLRHPPAIEGYSKGNNIDGNLRACLFYKDYYKDRPAPPPTRRRPFAWINNFSVNPFLIGEENVKLPSSSAIILKCEKCDNF